MKLLVTGAAGFIGSTLALELQKRYPEAGIFAVDDFWSGNFLNLAGYRGIFFPYSVCDAGFLELLRKVRFDAVFHIGAITDTTVNDQAAMNRVNTESFYYMLEILAPMHVPVIYASSASVYGKKPAPNRIEDGDSPLNVYAFSKLMMENTARHFMEENHEARITGLRFFNVYGPRERFKRNFASMVYQLTVKMLKGENPRLFKFGDQKRDFVYVKDIVEGIIGAWRSGTSGVFNLGSGKAVSFNETVAIINKNLNTSFKPEYFDNPYGAFYQEITQADLSLSSKIGYEPKWDIETGIADLIRTLKADPALYE